MVSKDSNLSTNLSPEQTMDSPLVRDFEVKQSKTNFPVPVIDGVHLHSIYNPQKEAESFVDQNEEMLKSNKNVLVFGLGFGYHIAHIIFRLNKFHNGNYKIFIVEPNRKLVNYSVKNGLFTPSKQCRVFCYSEIKNYFADRDLIQHMVKKPSVLPHPASFNLNQSFFKTFMSYKAPTDLKSISALLSEPAVKKQLNNNENILFDEYLEIIESQAEFTPEDFLLLAFKEVATTNRAGARNE